MKLVSIIVPVYNSEATIARCLESLLAQTHSHIELIVVDDGSADRSGVIIDDLAGEDRRITVVHTKNKGVSSARNTGLALASGELIGFADADDWADPDMVAHLTDIMEKDQADIAVCGYHQEVESRPDNPDPIKENDAARVVLSDRQAYVAALTTDGFKGYIFNKLFNAALISNNGLPIRFDESLHICEDLLFVCQCIHRAKSVVFDPTPLYHYFIAGQSASRTLFSPRKATLIDAGRKISDLTRQFYPALFGYTENLYLTNTAFIFLLSLHSPSQWAVDRQDVIRIRKRLCAYIFSWKNPFRYKLLLTGLSVSQKGLKALFTLFRCPNPRSGK